jgi:Zn-dependent protease
LEKNHDYIPNNYDTLSKLIQNNFQVEDERIREDGSIELNVKETETLKNDFEDFIKKLKPEGYIAMLRRENNEPVLRVGKIFSKESKRSFKPLILLIATVLTVSIDGFFFRTPILPGYAFTTTALLYVFGIMGIIGMHELSHKVAGARHGMKSSLPYFIPGIPGLLPTFGAFISTKDPPINRNALFDLGISGPIAGLAITLVVGIGGALTTVGITEAQADIMGGEIVTSIDIFTLTVLSLFSNVPEGLIPVLSPLTFAATIGFLITFLNLMPAWQLDGGHIAAAALSRTQHKIATYLSIFILVILGFTVMAIFVIVLSFQTPEARPLDDVSKISLSRRLIFIGILILTAGLFYFAIWNNSYFELGVTFEEIMSSIGT